MAAAMEDSMVAAVEVEQLQKVIQAQRTQIALLSSSLNQIAPGGNDGSGHRAKQTFDYGNRSNKVLEQVAEHSLGL